MKQESVKKIGGDYSNKRKTISTLLYLLIVINHKRTFLNYTMQTKTQVPKLKHF